MPSIEVDEDDLKAALLSYAQMQRELKRLRQDHERVLARLKTEQDKSRKELRCLTQNIRVYKPLLEGLLKRRDARERLKEAITERALGTFVVAAAAYVGWSLVVGFARFLQKMTIGG